MNQNQQYFSNSQTPFAQGFAGTDVQHVRQQNMQSQQGMQQNFNQPQQQFANQAPFAQGFAGTDVQHVRQQNAQSQAQAQGMMQAGQQSQQQPMQNQGAYQNFQGAQAPFSQNFAGTDVQHVRQQNAQSQAQAQGMMQAGQQSQQQPMQNQRAYQNFQGSQAPFSQNFAGTDVQHVRQQNAQSQAQAQGMMQAGQQSQQQPMQNQGAYQNFQGSQTPFSQGFAGTDVQHVRQQNAQAQGNFSYFNQ